MFVRACEREREKLARRIGPPNRSIRKRKKIEIENRQTEDILKKNPKTRKNKYDETAGCQVSYIISEILG